MQNLSENIYKILIVGDGNVGKTSYINKIITGKLNESHDLGDKEAKFNTNTGKKIILKLIDNDYNIKILESIEKSDKFDFIIIMFDFENKSSYDNISNLYNFVVKMTENNSILLVGNKCETRHPEIFQIDINFHLKKNIDYYSISTKSNYNIEKPILYIVRKLLNDSNIHFV